MTKATTLFIILVCVASAVADESGGAQSLIGKWTRTENATNYEIAINESNNQLSLSFIWFPVGNRGRAKGFQNVEIEANKVNPTLGYLRFSLSNTAVQSYYWNMVNERLIIACEDGNTIFSGEYESSDD